MRSFDKLLWTVVAILQRFQYASIHCRILWTVDLVSYVNTELNKVSF